MFFKLQQRLMRMLMVHVRCVEVGVFKGFVGMNMAVLQLPHFLSILMQMIVMAILMVMAVFMSQRFMPVRMLVLLNCSKIGADHHQAQSKDE